MPQGTRNVASDLQKRTDIMDIDQMLMVNPVTKEPMYMEYKSLFEGVIRRNYRDTISDLETLPRLGQNNVVVLEPLKFGSFKYFPSDSGLTRNGGTVYNCIDGGFWVRQYKGNLDAKWFDGVKADGINDDTAGLQLALDAQGVLSDNTDADIGSTLGWAPILFFAHGVFLTSAPLINKTSYCRIEGVNAALKAHNFVGNHGFSANGNAWRISIKGLQFCDYPIAVYLNSNNINSGLVEISNCLFFGSTEYAIWLNCQSTNTQIKNCLFRENKHECYIETGDLVEWKGGWINRGSNPLTVDRDAGIINHGHLIMRDVLGVPFVQTVEEPAWVNNYNTFRAYSCRFGGESGGFTVVNNFAKWQRNLSLKKRVIIEGCDVFSAAGDRTPVRIFEIPSQINFISDSGFPSQRYLNWSSTIDAATQQIKIDEIEQIDIDRREVGFTFVGNSGAYAVDGSGVLPIVPENLQFLVNRFWGYNFIINPNQSYVIGHPKSPVRPSSFHSVGSTANPATVLLENPGTALNVDDVLGQLLFWSGDLSGTSGTVGAFIKGIQASASPSESALVFGAGGVSGAVTRLKMDQDGNFYPVDDNIRSLGLSTKKWSKIYSTSFEGIGTTAFEGLGSTANPATVLLKNIGTALNPGDILGKIDFFSGDLSSSSGKVVAYIKGIQATASPSAGALVFGSGGLTPSDRIKMDENGDFSPIVDNVRNLGLASNRWAEIFAGNGVINTSDVREKQQVRDLDEAENAVALKCKKLIKAFRWNHAVEEKGDKARWHFGVMAQDVATAFESEGLDPHEYGLFCYDQWYDGPIGTKKGKLKEQKPNRDRYGVRYDQLLAFIISAI